MRGALPLALAALAGWVAPGCGGGGGDSVAAAGDTDAVEQVDPACVDVPVVTWNNWGEGFIIERCQSCHASASSARYGAPEEVTFDSLADVQALRARVLARAGGDDPTMPPSGGVPGDDRYLLEVWLTCWE